MSSAASWRTTLSLSRTTLYALRRVLFPSITSPLSALRKDLPLSPMPSTGSLAHRSSLVTDPDQLRDAVYGTSLRIDRLSPSRASSRIEQFQSAAGWGLDFASLSYKLHAQGPLAPGCVGVVVVRRASDTTMCGVKMEDSAIVLIARGSMLSVNLMPGFSYVGTTLPASIWAAAQQTEDGTVTELAPDHVIARRLPVGRMAAIERELEYLRKRLGAQAADPSALVQRHTSWLAQLFADGAGREPRSSRAMRSHLRHARRARDWIHAHIGDPIAIADLCAALGTSRRQLEYSFHSAYDLSPGQYITALRLNEIRRALLSQRTNGLTVTEIALSFGISHLSRFAAQYRKLFGELPSETRRVRAVK